MDTIELGDEVKCKITGFKGTVTAMAKCLTGCDRIEIKPPVDKQGKLNDSYWFDLDACEIIKKRKITPKEVTGKVKGGPTTRSTLK